MAGRNTVWDTPLGQARISELQASAAPSAKVPASSRNVRRMYNSARESRLTADWSASNGSADSELVTSLTKIRARSRALIRDVAYAKRCQILVVNNVIGANGIGMQAQVMTSRDTLSERVNDAIEEEWSEWSEAANCHTGGRLGFPHLERAIMAQVFSAGECFIRKHYRTFGRSKVPYALELIEAERVADELTSPYLSAQNSNHVRMGVEVDEFYRPVAYFIRRRHPNEFRLSSATPDMVERVPADQIIHLAIIDRWPQTRGEPWMHAVARTFNDIAGYTESEITRARAQASVPWTIETVEDSDSFGEPAAGQSGSDGDGSVEMEIEPGIAKRLMPGEKMNAPAPNSPNPALDPFMRYMLRELSAGTGPSYSSMSRDYSQATYSSERVAQLDDRDLWRFYQRWFVLGFRQLVHREWLQAAVFAQAIAGISVDEYALNTRKFEKVLFKPRGWSWIDPAKEVAAFDQAVKSGYTTLTDVIAQTAGGQDIEDIVRTRVRELKMLRQAELVFETSPEFYTADAQKAAAEAKATAKGAKAPPDDPPDKPPESEEESTENPPARRVFAFQRKLL